MLNPIQDWELAELASHGVTHRIRRVARELQLWRAGIISKMPNGETVVEDPLCSTKGCSNVARWALKGSYEPDMCSLCDMASGREGHRP